MSDTLQALLSNSLTFPEKGTKHYHDHDFLFSEYLIKPDEYLLLQGKNAISDKSELETNKQVEKSSRRLIMWSSSLTSEPLTYQKRCNRSLSVAEVSAK